MNDVTKSPLVLFLSAVLGAFTAGAGALLFLGEQIDSRIIAHTEAKPHEELPSVKDIAAELRPEVVEILNTEGRAVIPRGSQEDMKKVATMATTTAPRQPLSSFCSHSLPEARYNGLPTPTAWRNSCCAMHVALSTS